MSLLVALACCVLVPVVWPAGPRARRNRRPISLGAAAPAPVPGAAAQTGMQFDVGALPGRPPDEDVLCVAAALDLMALTLRSGVPLETAVEAVADRSGPVVRAALKRVVAALRWGVADATAWESLPSVWRPAGQAVALAGMAGVPPAGLLARAAADMRLAEHRRIEVATGRLSVLVVLPLGLCFLPAFALLTVVPVVAVLAGSLLAGVT